METVFDTVVKSKKYIYWLENILTNSKYIYYQLTIKNPANFSSKTGRKDADYLLISCVFSGEPNMPFHLFKKNRKALNEILFIVWPVKETNLKHDTFFYNYIYVYLFS